MGGGRHKLGGGAHMMGEDMQIVGEGMHLGGKGRYARNVSSTEIGWTPLLGCDLLPPFGPSSRVLYNETPDGLCTPGGIFAIKWIFWRP